MILKMKISKKKGKKKLSVVGDDNDSDNDIASALTQLFYSPSLVFLFLLFPSIFFSKKHKT